MKSNHIVADCIEVFAHPNDLLSQLLSPVMEFEVINLFDEHRSITREVILDFT